LYIQEKIPAHPYNPIISHLTKKVKLRDPHPDEARVEKRHFPWGPHPDRRPERGRGIFQGAPARTEGPSGEEEKATRKRKTSSLLEVFLKRVDLDVG